MPNRLPDKPVATPVVCRNGLLPSLDVRAERAASLLGATELFSELAPEPLTRLGERAVERRYEKGSSSSGKGIRGTHYSSSSRDS